MGAARVLDHTGPATAPRPVRHLSVVREADPCEPGAGVDLTRSASLATPLPTRTVRLTARGRRVILGFLASVIAATLLVFASTGAATVEQPRQVVVEQGQTLSEIALVELPDVGLRRAVIEIQLANSLSTDRIHTGQVLVIPELD